MNNDPNNNFNNLVSPQPEPQPVAPQSAPQPAPSQPENPQPITSQPEASEPIASQPIVSQPDTPAPVDAPLIDQTPASTPIQPTPAPKKRKNPLPIIIIAAVVIALIVVGIIFIPKLIGGKGKDEKSLAESLKGSDSFFIQDGDSKLYAIFDIHGNQLTDFSFTSHWEFINGAAIVENKDEERGIIGDNGKMIVDFGICKYLHRNGALYDCTDKEYNESLVDANGKTILEGKDLDIGSVGYSDIVTLVKQSEEDDEDGGTYTIYNYNGDAITSFPVNAKADRTPTAGDSMGNYTAVSYDGTVYVLDSAKSKLLLTFEDNTPFCVASINASNVNEFTITACEQLGKEAKDEHKLIRDGKIAFTKTGNGGSRLYFDEDVLIYYDKDGQYYLLDENGDKVVKQYDAIYKDYKNYIAEDTKNNGKMNLYVNGEKQKQISCDYLDSGYAYQGIYTLKYCDGFDKGEKIFMKYDGTVINKKSYESIYEFDDNGYAGVSEDGEHYYLINTDGDSVSAEYAGRIHRVYGTKDVYYSTDENDKTSVFKAGGDIIATGSDIQGYSTITPRSDVCISLKQGSKYEVYNVSEGKQIATLDSEPYLTEKYFYAKENGKIRYYTNIDGKMFYEGKE